MVRACHPRHLRHRPLPGVGMVTGVTMESACTMLNFDKGLRMPLVPSRRSDFMVAISMKIATAQMETSVRKSMLFACVLLGRHFQIVMTAHLLCLLMNGGQRFRFGIQRGTCQWCVKRNPKQVH